MKFDELKEAWQTQTLQCHLTVHTAELLNKVRRDQRHFASMVFWRDVREMGVALLLVPFWFYLGRRLTLPWIWYLAVPVLLWVAGFHLVDRIRHKRRQPKPGDTLRECIEGSLIQTEHQISLLRNVFWWNLLPFSIAILTFFAQRAWLARDHGLATLFRAGGAAAVLALIFWSVYRANRYAVRKLLEPRRRELKDLLESLQSDSE